MTTRSPWLTVKEAAARVRLCESAFRKAVQQGRMPSGRSPTHGGRRKLWLAEELDAALLGKKDAGPADPIMAAINAAQAKAAEIRRGDKG